jgi:23S rRNA (guanosine2251-2'-O)-methyltransferase
MPAALGQKEVYMEFKNNAIIIGKNAVLEAIISNREIDHILIAQGLQNKNTSNVLSKAKQAGIFQKTVSRQKLDNICNGANHQGVVAVVAAHKYSSIEDIFKSATAKNELPFILIADEIEDPHNLGAIIRTAECAGVHGIIIPKRRAAGLNFTVSKASAGAIEHIPIVRETNLSRVITELKKRNIWIYGADMSGESCYNLDLKGPMALIVGNEGHGISRILKEKCDRLVSLPLCGKINSLNVSVATGVLLYEILRQRSN